MGEGSLTGGSTIVQVEDNGGLDQSENSEGGEGYSDLDIY